MASMQKRANPNFKKLQAIGKLIDIYTWKQVTIFFKGIIREYVLRITSPSLGFDENMKKRKVKNKERLKQ